MPVELIVIAGDDGIGRHYVVERDKFANITSLRLQEPDSWDLGIPAKEPMYRLALIP